MISRIDNGPKSSKTRMKSVRFQSVEIIELPMILGCNPSVSRGPPLEIGWDLIRKTQVDLASYENNRSPRRTTKGLVVSHFSRVNFLLYCGYTQKEIDEASAGAEEVRKMRFLTQLSNNCRTEGVAAEPNNNKRLAQTRLSNRFDIVQATTSSKSQQQLAQPPMVPTRITSPTPTCKKRTTRTMPRKASLDSLIQCPVRMPSPRPKQMKRASWCGGATDEPILPIPVRRASPVAAEQRKTVRNTPFDMNPRLLLSPQHSYAIHSSVVMPPRQKRAMVTIATC